MREIPGRKCLQPRGRLLGYQQRHNQRHPKTSPAVPSLGEERCHSGGIGLCAGWVSGKQRIGYGCAAWPHHARISRDNRPLSSPSPSLVTSSRRATGRPRSTMRTGEPFLRPAIRALRWFLASVILAFFISSQIGGFFMPFKLFSFWPIMY
jgi:hypothetical protein